MLGAYLGVVLLHGLWNAAPGVLAALVGTGLGIFIGQLVIGAIGLFVLWRLWAQGVEGQEA